jgi:hypothetical protein
VLCRLRPLMLINERADPLNMADHGLGSFRISFSDDLDCDRNLIRPHRRKFGILIY